MDKQNNKHPGDLDAARILSDKLDALLNEDWEIHQPAEEETQKCEPQPTAQVSEQPEKRKNSFRSQRDELILCHDLVYILAAVVLFFTFFIRMSRVEGGSMNPTLVNHDRMLLLSNVWYSEPQRGDVVVARVPSFSSEPIVKRVIAVAGDTVDIDFACGIVYVNGQALDEPYVQELTHDDFGAEGIQLPLVVKKNHVFLMGDNRNDSYDSRYRGIGQVDERCILGKAIFITMPGKDPDTGDRDFSRFGFLDWE